MSGLPNCNACFYCVQCMIVLHVVIFWINIAKKRMLDHPKLFRHYQSWHFVSNDKTGVPKNGNVKKFPHMWDTKSLDVSRFFLDLILFIPEPICPESFTLLAFLFMQEYMERKMDKKKAKKPTDQNCFHGTNKYTNCSHEYLSVFLVFVLFPAEMWPTWKKILEKMKAYQDVVRRLLKWDSIFKATYSLP